MIFAYLDEFGHAGPFFGKQHPNYNTSPVFGLAGILLPESSTRPFATKFLKLKENLLKEQIQSSGKYGYNWEKKGTNLFTANSIIKYPDVRKSMLRLINEVRNSQGKIFYVGREKKRDTSDVRAVGLYTTVFSSAIRQIGAYCDSINENFVLIVDEHSARKELLETAAKTMFGANPVRRLLSPPFEVESYLNQNIQAADWIASIVGRLWNYKLDPDDFSNYAHYNKYYWQRLHSVSTHSSVTPRSKSPPENNQSQSPTTDFGKKLQKALLENKVDFSLEVKTIDIHIEENIIRHSSE